MTTTQTRTALNGVDVPTLFATLDAVRAQPEIADFQFRATNDKQLKMRGPCGGGPGR